VFAQKGVTTSLTMQSLPPVYCIIISCVNQTKKKNPLNHKILFVIPVW